MQPANNNACATSGKKPVLFRVTNNLNIGGITSRLRLVLPLLTKFFEVHVVTYKEQGVLVEELKQKGVHVHHLPIKGKWSPLSIYQYAKLFRQYKADIVHTHSFGGNITGILAAALARVPVRVGQVHARSKHWYGATKARQAKQQREEFIVHSLFTDAVLFPAQVAKEHFAQYCHLPDAMLRVLHNGIDLSHAQEPHVDYNLRKEYGIADDAIILGYLGRLDAPKGIYFALEFMKQLANSKQKYVLVIVGGGTSEQEDEDVKKAFACLDKNAVVFAGMRNDVHNFYKQFDVFFFPSNPEEEALPGVILEAAAYGLPILSRQNAAVKAIGALYNRIWYMNDTDNPEETLTNVLAMPAASSEKIWQTYGIEKMANDTKVLYNEFLQRKGKPLAR